MAMIVTSLADTLLDIAMAFAKTMLASGLVVRAVALAFDIFTSILPILITSSRVMVELVTVLVAWVVGIFVEVVELLVVVVLVVVRIMPCSLFHACVRPSLSWSSEMPVAAETADTCAADRLCSIKVMGTPS